MEQEENKETIETIENQETVENKEPKQADVVIERHFTPSSRETMPGPGKFFKLLFGFIMVAIYLLMGLWLAGWADFGYPFQFGYDDTPYEWTKYVVGGALILYGGYRAYRYIKGDYYSR